jgi:hypothetical protein
MPIRKFRSIEEMKSPRWREPGDPELYRAMKALWDLAMRTRTRRRPAGVRRFRSIEEMTRAREAWEAEPDSD